jgi:prepilin signal peptidase PulO-like enzyme (type II secretory pathway)
MGRKNLKVAAAVLLGLWFFYAIFFAGPWPGYLQFLTSAILVAAGFLALMSKLGKWELRRDGSVPWTGARRRRGARKTGEVASGFGEPEGARHRAVPVDPQRSGPPRSGQRS